ncbi:MAG: hypothetical protein D6784_12845 [Chloroflexi bacterium]|nr:MAG: hypothetical protein D6784_12845 [Chloroflexota bacterium]
MKHTCNFPRWLTIRRVRPGFILLTLLALWLAAGIALAAPPAQDPRDDGTGGGGGGGPVGGQEATHDTDGKPRTCAALKGQVLNWGFGPQPNVVVKLQTGSWQVAATSADDGNYGFGGLGIGIARLHVDLPADLAQTHRPLVQDAGVYLSCDFPTIANVALYPGGSIQPPATISASAAGTAAPNQTATLTLRAVNNLPTPISDVVITALMEPGLIPLDVQAPDAQIARILDGGPDGRLVGVYLQSLPSGQETRVTITLTAAEDAVAGTRLSTTAALFYRESAAHQTSLEFIVGRGAVVAPPEVEVAAPQAEATAEITPEPTTTPSPEPTIEPEPSPTVEAEAFVPPPGQMPTTGDDLVPPGLLPTTGALPLLPETGVGLWLPASGLGLLGLAFLARLWRTGRK